MRILYVNVGNRCLVSICCSTDWANRQHTPAVQDSNLRHTAPKAKKDEASSQHCRLSSGFIPLASLLLHYTSSDCICQYFFWFIFRNSGNLSPGLVVMNTSRLLAAKHSLYRIRKKDGRHSRNLGKSPSIWRANARRLTHNLTADYPWCNPCQRP